jgi:hypothetical protein
MEVASPTEKVPQPHAVAIDATSRSRPWIYRGLSVLIAYHLAAILLFPNSDNSAGVALGRFVRPYLFFFEMTNGWNFFAPNPEPPIYIQYELFGEGGKQLEQGTWPDKKNPFWIRDRQNRRVSATDFMMSAELRTERMMVPLLCGRSSKTTSVSLWRVMYNTPTPQEIVSGKRKLGDEVGLERKFVSHSFCPALPPALAETGR